MDSEDKLSRLIQESGLFNEISSDEEWTPDNFKINDADKKLKLSGAWSATNIDIYTDLSPSCSYSTAHMEVEQNEALDVELNSLSESRPSENLVEPLQIIEEDPVTDSNISVKNITDRKIIRLNCETGNFETDSEESEVEVEEKIKKGNKRVAKPEMWEKNISRKRKIQDHTLREINDCRFPRKDICSTCEKFQVDIQSAEIMKDKDKVSSLKSERELHLRKGEVFLKKCSSSEKEDKN
ncbi:unnamed protein product [Parnassius apollo]|uniref:(apollo) hypothetical protein n=1 Tax=Parnassius apollo TaxID=110799 RepID=A0A8S3XQQ9_PARAO|nr:unnamed protein product [Parnassius apollo]